jgi:hypothetical protein
MTNEHYAQPRQQYAYVLVSSGIDRHSRMAWLSASSLRRQQRTATIVLIAEATSSTAAGEIELMFEGLADRIVWKTSGDPSPVVKNRIHRIHLREYLSGDVLYIDSDTVVVRPLDPIWQGVGQIGAVIDFNYPPERQWCPPDMETPFRELGWDFPVLPYLNSGVVRMQDHAEVYRFSEEWLVRFRASTLMPHLWDQVTFNSALRATGVSCDVLPNGYNAMVVMQNYRAHEARILHFFGSPEQQVGTIMEHLLRHHERTGEFDDQAYRAAVDGNHPWGPNPKGWQFMRSRNYVRAVTAKARSVLGLVRK